MSYILMIGSFGLFMDVCVMDLSLTKYCQKVHYSLVS